MDGPFDGFVREHAVRLGHQLLEVVGGDIWGDDLGARYREVVVLLLLRCLVLSLGGPLLLLTRVGTGHYNRQRKRIHHVRVLTHLLHQESQLVCLPAVQQVLSRALGLLGS